MPLEDLAGSGSAFASNPFGNAPPFLLAATFAAFAAASAAAASAAAFASSIFCCSNLFR